MSSPAVLWTTTELPGQAFADDPEPDDEDGPWCRTAGLLPEQRDRVEVATVIGELL